MFQLIVYDLPSPMSSSTNHFFIAGSNLAVARMHPRLDARGGPSHGPGVADQLPVVASQDPEINTEPTAHQLVNSAASSTTDSSFEDLMMELDLLHLNSSIRRQESPYHTADSYEQLFRSRVP